MIRTEHQELKRQLQFRKTMLARRKARLKEAISADEWRIKQLEAKVSGLEKQEAK